MVKFSSLSQLFFHFFHFLHFMCMYKTSASRLQNIKLSLSTWMVCKLVNVHKGSKSHTAVSTFQRYNDEMYTFLENFKILMFKIKNVEF